MAWNGSKLTVAGVEAVFSEFGVSTPVLNEELGFYGCTVKDGEIQAKTLVRLAQKVIQALMD